MQAEVRLPRREMYWRVFAIVAAAAVVHFRCVAARALVESIVSRASLEFAPGFPPVFLRRGSFFRRLCL